MLLVLSHTYRQSHVVTTMGSALYCQDHGSDALLSQRGSSILQHSAALISHHDNSTNCSEYRDSHENAPACISLCWQLSQNTALLKGYLTAQCQTCYMQDIQAMAAPCNTTT